MEKRLDIVVCKGPTCGFMGGSDLEAWCRDLEAAGLPIRHEICGCTGNCMESPVVVWNGKFVTEADPEKLTALLIEEGIM